MEDNYIWKEIKQNNKKALKKLHDKYFHQMYLYASKTLDGNSSLAEEIVSDCFIKLWESRKKIEIESSIKYYLYLILRNNIIDYSRKNRLITEPITRDFISLEDQKFFDDQKQFVKLYLAIKKLPLQCRKILELAVFENLTYNEIAEKLNISKNTVKTQIGRAYKRLREMLDPNDFNFFLTVRKQKL